MKINIAIDGYSSCGKGTLAKFLAKKLNYLFIDSGAMYRAVTYYFLQNGIDFNDHNAVAMALGNIDIHFTYNEKNEFYETYLNGQNIEKDIRTMQVSEIVSHVSTISDVRRFLVSQQQKIGREKGVVMDGRDIGTVVFPDAELKIFMTASSEVRARRRYNELTQAGGSVTFEEVLHNIKQRDHIDSTRSDSPLKKAPGARMLDNTSMSKDEQASLALGWVMEILDGKAVNR